MSGPSTNPNSLRWLDFEEHLRTPPLQRQIHMLIAKIWFGNMTMTLSWHPTFTLRRHKAGFLLSKLSQWAAPLQWPPAVIFTFGLFNRRNSQWYKIMYLIRWSEGWGCNSGEMPWKELVTCVYDTLHVKSFLLMMVRRRADRQSTQLHWRCMKPLNETKYLLTISSELWMLG